MALLTQANMSSHHTKAVFFDAAGTLFTVKGSVGEIYAWLAREHGKEVTVADLEAGFRRHFSSAPPLAFPGATAEQSLHLEKKWWRDLVRRVFNPLVPFPRFDAYFDALFGHFAQARAWQLYPETVETLTILADQGLRLGVISNFDSRLFRLLEEFGIAPFFDPIVISTQAGAAKPDSGIFLQALASLKLSPREALHVGDSYEMDIVGARRVGLTPVLVDRRGNAEGADHYHTVKSLSELISILDR